MKEINLLPSNIAFDYKKFVIIKLSILFLALNVVFLFCISFVNIYINKSLQAKLMERQRYLSQIEQMNNEFGKYKNRYVKLKKELVKLKDDIKYYKRIVVLHRSAFADSIVFVNTFFGGVWFDLVTYDNGVFNIQGYAPSKDKFQQFYSLLEQNKYIGNIEFFYIKKKDDKYIFKINYKVIFR